MVITNLTAILFALILCALFPANTQATNSLSEKFSKCESEFWYKSSHHFKQSLKSKCLKENNHYQNGKRHRQHHICNNKSYDKKATLSKWRKFADCRCKSALAELSNSKKEPVSVCYQISQFNKATGKFLGELTVYKKNPKDHFKVAVKFSNRISKIDGEYRNGSYRLKRYNSNKYVDRYYISGKISKSDSMNKVSFDRISPTSVKLFADNCKPRTLNRNEFAIIPFSKFVLNDICPEKNFVQKDRLKPKNGKGNKNGKNNKKNPDKDEKNKDEKNNPNKDEKNKDEKNNPNKDEKNKDEKNNKNENEKNDKKNPNKNEKKPEQPQQQQPPPEQPQTPSDQSNQPQPSPDQPQPPPEQPSPDQPQPPPGQLPSEQSEQQPSPDQSSPQGDNYGNDNNETPKTPTSTSSSQGPKSSTNSANFNNVPGEEVKTAPVGLIVFACIVAIGAAFVGYNTYERIKWRRQYRRRQAAEQSFAIANVPDYNGGGGGYGKAY